MFIRNPAIKQAVIFEAEELV